MLTPDEAIALLKEIAELKLRLLATQQALENEVQKHQEEEKDE